MAELITANEMAERLRLRPTTVRRWARTGRIPAIRVSSKVIRFDPRAVERALREISFRRQKGGAHHVR